MVEDLMKTDEVDNPVDRRDVRSYEDDGIIWEVVGIGWIAGELVGVIVSVKFSKE